MSVTERLGAAFICHRPDGKCPHRGACEDLRGCLASARQQSPPPVQSEQSEELPPSQWGEPTSKWLPGLPERKPLDEIAQLVRALTYGEMMELAAGLANEFPDGSVTQDALPGMLHRWSRK